MIEVFLSLLNKVNMDWLFHCLDCLFLCSFVSFYFSESLFVCSVVCLGGLIHSCAGSLAYSFI